MKTPPKLPVSESPDIKDEDVKVLNDFAKSKRIMSKSPKELDTLFGVYMTNSGLEYSIRIGKTPIKVRDEDFQLMKRDLMDWHNSEMVKMLDRLEEQKRRADDFVGDVYVVRVNRLQSERNKLERTSDEEN